MAEIAKHRNYSQDQGRGVTRPVATLPTFLTWYPGFVCEGLEMAPAAAFVFAKALARQYDLDGHPSYSMRHFNSLLVNFVLWMLSAAPAKRMLQNEACVALSYIDCDGDPGFAGGACASVYRTAQ
ncbi:hypothetical protein M2221_009109 [Bradyrhizobium elkanii]|nr:hypothetical protein [Bradyrhizobium elkanii]MCW2380303.1 hypothetical protein [Bradyrhizobium elkanii]